MDRSEVAAALPAAVPGLLRFAQSLTPDPSAAEDLVQDTLSRALERSPTFRGDASVDTWLHRILHNLAVDRARRNREEPSEDVVEAVEARWREDDYTVDAASVVARAEDRSDLRDALSHLPVPYRTAVLLHDGEGRTTPEVAQIQDVSLAAAKQRLRRGRMMLVSQLAAGEQRRAELRGVPLRCWEARRYIGAYLDGELETATARRVERHLEACPTCPPLFAALVGTTHALRDTSRDPDSVLPPELIARIAGE